MQIIPTTRRLCRAKATRRSIIEKHSALHHDAIANLEAALDHGLITLLKTDVDRDSPESPSRHCGRPAWVTARVTWRHLDEHLIDVILQHQRGGGNDRHHLAGGEER